MGEVTEVSGRWKTREQVVELLKADNPGCRASDVAMYAVVFMDYQEAQSNIEEHGNMVLHPRTGTPMENPYGIIKERALASLRKMNQLDYVDRLWDESAAPASAPKGRR